MSTATAVEPIIDLRIPPPTSPLMTGAQAAEEFARNLVVIDDESYAFADKQLSDLKGKAKRLEDERRAIVDPINAGVKRVNDLFRPAREFYERAEALIKRKMLDFHSEQAKARAEAERIARAAAETERRAREAEALARADEAAKAGDAEASQRALEEAVAPAAPPIITVPTAPRGASTSVSMVWKADPIDLDACIKAAAAGDRNARACLTWNSAEITSRCRALKGDFNVPGIKVVEIPQMAARARV